MERELEATKYRYITNDHFPTIADFALYPWIKIHFWAGVKIDGLDHLKKWMDTMAKLPYVRKGINMPPKPKTTKSEAEMTKKGGRMTIVGNTVPGKPTNSKL